MYQSRSIHDPVHPHVEYTMHVPLPRSHEEVLSTHEGINAGPHEQEWDVWDMEFSNEYPEFDWLVDFGIL
jgi:hypothetical protein